MVKGLVTGGKLDAEVATALDLDSIIGVRANSTAASGEARKAMGNTFQVEQAAPETLTATISWRSTSVLVGSGEGLSLPPFHGPSFGRDSEFPFEEEQSSLLRVDAKQIGSPSESVAISTPSLAKAFLLEATLDAGEGFTEAKVHMADRLKN